MSNSEEFLTSLTQLSLIKLKTLIWQSELFSSLPITLHGFIKEELKKPLQESNPNLAVFARVALLCATHPKKPFSAMQLLPSAQELHNNLVIFEEDEILSSEIANLCEEWWKEQLPERETLISQFLPFLLSRSFKLQKKADVRRVYALREAFGLLDFEDESIKDLERLLLRCAITPPYLKTNEGRRFISFSFGLSLQLVKQVLALIKSQIPYAGKLVLEAYAEILFRAWKVAEGAFRDEIETWLQQDLIFGIIHAKTESLNASARRVLCGFINQRSTDCGVEKLLLRLVEPLLFRSLKVFNSNIRHNALHLLLDMFPLEDPDSTKEAKDNLLEQQFDLLEKLIEKDPCPDIRVVAIEGCCRILHLFWETIPSSFITKILIKIVDEMSYDGCYEIRLSTVKGIIYLLGNPQTHDILKVLLPRLSHLFTDPVTSVRVSFADLLLVLRDLQKFQFHKVVSLDTILSSLADDKQSVAQKITRLLIPTYFPSEVAAEVACSRCITLIKRSPMAGARFCEFLISEGSSPTSLMELVNACVTLAFSSDVNADQIKGLLVATANLCENLMKKASCRNGLKDLFSGDKLMRLYIAAATEHAQTSIFNIASIVSPNDVIGFREACMTRINNCGGLSDNVERQAEVRSVHKAMMSFGWFDEMFGAITKLLQVAASWCHTEFGTEMPKQSLSSVKQMKTKSSGKGKRSTSCDDTTKVDEGFIISVGAAWQIKDLLKNDCTRDAVLKSPKLELAFSALKVLSEVSIKQSMSCEHMDIAPVLAYTALVLHMSHQNTQLTESSDARGKNDELDSARSLLKEKVLDFSLNHLIGCTENIFSASISGIHPNMVKMVTAVLKFIVDATSMNPVSPNQERCLQFASACVEFFISTVRKHSDDGTQFKEEDLKETLIWFRCCFTYAAKLLYFVQKNGKSLPEVSDLANHLLDLFMWIELNLGSKPAMSLLSAAEKDWLPDLILALGFSRIFTNSSKDRDCTGASDQGNTTSHQWLSFLGKIELRELTKLSQDEDASDTEPNVGSAFSKLMEMMVVQLRRNLTVLGAVGIIFLNGSLLGMETEDYELVLGLVHFVCKKLVRHEDGEREELKVMLASLQEFYSKIEVGIKNSQISEDRMQFLENAKILIEPFLCI